MSCLNYTDALEGLKEIGTSTDADLRSEMFELAIRYARLRVDWLQAGAGGDAVLGATRTRAHNAFIDSLNILSRQAAKSGKSIAWRERLGGDRKVIGDFACHFHAILGLRAR
jgi:hypothetical protein